MDKKKIVPFIKKFFKPNQLIVILFILLIVLAVIPSVGYWKSDDKIVFYKGGNFCALHPEEEYDEVCRPKFYYWKLNKILWPVNLISLTTSQNSVIYADSSAESYNIPTTIQNTEFLGLYISSYFNELNIHISEFRHVNKFQSLTEHIIPRILKPAILIIYWYLLACIISFLLLYFFFYYKKYPKINLLTICFSFLISILCLIYGFYLGFFIPALETTKNQIVGRVSEHLTLSTIKIGRF